MSTNCARHAKQRDRPLLPPSIACLEVVRWGDMRCKIKTAPSPPLTPSLLQVCEQLMTMHLAGRRSAAGKPSPGKSHLLRHSQLAAGVPDAIVSHTKGHADVVGKIQRYKICKLKRRPTLSRNLQFCNLLLKLQKPPAPAAPREQTSPVHKAARGQTVTCLAQFAPSHQAGKTQGESSHRSQSPISSGDWGSPPSNLPSTQNVDQRLP